MEPICFELVLFNKNNPYLAFKLTSICKQVALLWKHKIDDHTFDTLLVSMQVRIIKEIYGNQIGELYHSLPYHMIEFVLEDFDWQVCFLQYFVFYMNYIMFLFQLFVITSIQLEEFLFCFSFVRACPTLANYHRQNQETSVGGFSTHSQLVLL